jgi:predicted NBD/HSP70 family sugar kinase
MPGTQLVRHINQARTLDLLRRHRTLSRAEIARRLGLTRSTLSELTTALVEEGLVIEDGGPVVHSRGGRPGSGLRLNPAGATFLGAELGNDRITVVALSLDARELARLREPIDGDRDVGAVVARLAGLVRRAIRRAGVAAAAVRGLGVSVPGMLGPDGTVFWLPRLGWRNVDLQGMLEKALGIPVCLDNDANAAALAELYFGEAADGADLLYVMLGIGIGAGLIADRGLYRGAGGRAGEIGHIRLDPSGPRCQCGGLGCFEAVAGQPALLRYDRDAGGTASSADQVLEHAAAEDAAARAAVGRWMYWLGRGIASAVYLLDARRVILGGSLAVQVPSLAQDLSAILRAENVPKADELQLTTSQLGADGVAIGGAALIYQKLFQIPRSHEDGPVAAVAAS